MPRTILIVEDAAHYASALEMAFLAIPNVEVAHALTGRQALKYLSSRGAPEVAALVTDLQMPVMDGFELIEQVRSAAHWARLPIVVISGDTNPETPDRLKRLGADAYFTKPYSPGEVRKKVEELLNAGR